MLELIIIRFLPEVLCLTFFFFYFIKYLFLVSRMMLGTKNVTFGQIFHGEAGMSRAEFLSETESFRSSIIVLLLVLLAIILNDFIIGVEVRNDIWMSTDFDFVRDFFWMGTAYESFFIGMLLILFLLFLLISHKLEKGMFYQNEFLIFVVLLLFFVLLLFKVSNLLLLYILYEAVSLSLYILITASRANIKQTEAGLKYFVLSALTSMFFLFGLFNVYSVFGTFKLEEIAYMVTTNSSVISTDYMLGVLLIVVALLFKIGVAPFHVWVVEVYTGINTQSFFFLAILSKYIFVILFFQLFMNFVYIFQDSFKWIYLVLGLLSLVVGTVGPVMNREFKAIFAYGSISNVGFMFLTLFMYTIWNTASFLFYVSMYLMMMLGVFCVALLVNYRSLEFKFFEDLKQLSNGSMFYAMVFLSLLLSMAGIPPFIGFFSKFFVLLSLNISNIDFSYIIAFIMCINAVGLYVYIRMVVAMFYSSKQYSVSQFEGRIAIKYILVGLFLLNSVCALAFVNVYYDLIVASIFFLF